MSGKYDGYQANTNHIQPKGTYVRCGAHVTRLITSRATQTTTVVKRAMNSVKELGISYNNSGKLYCLYLQGGVSACERFETSLSHELGVMGNNCLEVS